MFEDPIDIYFAGKGDMFDARLRRDPHHLGDTPVVYDPADAAPTLPSIVRWTRRNPTKRAIILLICLGFLGVYSIRTWNRYSGLAAASAIEPEGWQDKPKPPLFERFHEAELALPQHHADNPFSRENKYLWVENHGHGELTLSLPRSDSEQVVTC